MDEMESKLRKSGKVASEIRSEIPNLVKVGKSLYSVVEFIESCPVWLKPKTGRNTEENLKDTQKLKIYDNKSRLGAFASKMIRGMTPTLLFWDETAWAEKGDIFWTSALAVRLTHCFKV